MLNHIRPHVFNSAPRHPTTFPLCVVLPVWTTNDYQQQQKKKSKDASSEIPTDTHQLQLSWFIPANDLYTLIQRAAQLFPFQSVQSHEQTQTHAHKVLSFIFITRRILWKCFYLRDSLMNYIFANNGARTRSLLPHLGPECVQSPRSVHIQKFYSQII